jgi:hypothetical protein
MSRSHVFQGGQEKLRFNILSILKAADYAQVRTNTEPVRFLRADQNPGLDARGRIDMVCAIACGSGAEQVYRQASNLSLASGSRSKRVS